jgi:hypothetical protein
MTFTLLEIPVIFGLSIEVYFILIIIAGTTFFFWRWLLRKIIKDGQKRKIFTWFATIIFTPIIYEGLIMLLLFGITYTPSRDFDKSQWLTDKEGRFQMASDIIDSKMLIAKDTNQVKQILGEPSLGSGSNWRQDTVNAWTYDMGNGGGGLGFMFHNLVVKFDKEQVINVEHVKIRD